jgi:hypothetical protein
MVPFVRKTSPQGVADLPLVPENDSLKAVSSTSSNNSYNMNEQAHDDEPKRQNRVGAWERRRRKLANRKKADDSSGAGSEATSTDSRRSGSMRSWRKSWGKKDDDDDDIDPYDSDPGESYREHCMKMEVSSSKTCLAVPLFLRNAKIASIKEEESVLTAPPSPLTSEMGDTPIGVAGQTPASLPNNLRRVRYSLRSSITDGSEKQLSDPSMMERRELRPNNIHLNVSHWSDEGGRPYMEDRYV